MPKCGSPIDSLQSISDKPPSLPGDTLGSTGYAAGMIVGETTAVVPKPPAAVHVIACVTVQDLHQPLGIDLLGQVLRLPLARSFGFLSLGAGLPLALYLSNGLVDGHLAVGLRAMLLIPLGPHQTRLAEESIQLASVLGVEGQHERQSRIRFALRLKLSLPAT